jgi:DNA polymerase-1
MKPKLLLIDGDEVAYHYAAASEEGFDWGEGIVTLAADTGTTWSNLEAAMQRYLASHAADKIVVCLSDDLNFRKTVYPAYKSNRKEVRKPMILRELKDRMRSTWETKSKTGLEADDVMAIISTNPLVYPEYDKIICSSDKDMQTVPGALWRFKYDSNDKPEVHFISEAEADRYWLTQTLTGDTSDGYPGCPKIGPVKAAKIVDGGWPAVVAAYIKAGLTEADALAQARCARILRATDFDYEKQEPILWTPPASSP